jgi:hypothetical protein
MMPDDETQGPFILRAPFINDEGCVIWGECVPRRRVPEGYMPYEPPVVTQQVAIEVIREHFAISDVEAEIKAFRW